MIINGCQRWREGRESYRPAREPFDPRAHEVVRMQKTRRGYTGPTVGEAKAFVERHHYSGSSSSTCRVFGLYERAELVGVAVFGQPVTGSVLDILPCPRDEALELGRLVLLERVLANAESWFVARCFEQLRADGYSGVISFADPEPRTTVAGRVAFGGHAGTIYQGLNAVYTGRGAADTQYLLPDGRAFTKRAAAKVRKRDVGWQYAVEQLVAAGATPPIEGEDLRAWLARERERVTRRRRHPGCFRYLFGLDRAAKRHLPAHLERCGIAPMPYPKLIAAPPLISPSSPRSP